MKTPFWQIILPLGALSAVFAENMFSVGNDVFVLAFNHHDFAEPFQQFVAEDVERVFVPLQNISNVVTAVASSGEIVGLTHISGYPEGFSNAFSVSNRNGQLVFEMNERLSEKYVRSYAEYAGKSNQVAQLNALLDSINSGAITNLAPEAFLSLVFLPAGFSEDATPEKARQLILSSRECVPISASILEYWTQNIGGESYLMAASKTAVTDELGTTLEPICWIYWNDSWQFCHPAILRCLPMDETAKNQ